MWGGFPERQHFALNHKRIWLHQPLTLEPVSEYLPQVRELIFAAQWKEAEDLFGEKMQPVEGDCGSGGPSSYRVNLYQPAGNLVLEMQGLGDVAKYARELDLDTAVATERFRSNGNSFQCESFVSAAQQVLVVHLTCDTPGQLNVRVTLQRQYDPLNCSTSGRFHDHTLTLLGHAVPDYWFGLAAHIIHRGGAVDPAGYQDGRHSSLLITGADEVWVLLDIATQDETDDPLDLCDNHLRDAESALPTLREVHVSEHRRLYRRASLRLGDPLPAKPTNELVDEMRTGITSPAPRTRRSR